MEWNEMKWNGMESIHNNIISHLYCYPAVASSPWLSLRRSVYNFGPEWRAGLNLSMNRNINSLFFAGSTIVLLIAKLRI